MLARLPPRFRRQAAPLPPSAGVPPPKASWTPRLRLVPSQEGNPPAIRGKANDAYPFPPSLPPPSGSATTLSGVPPPKASWTPRPRPHAERSLPTKPSRGATPRRTFDPRPKQRSLAALPPRLKAGILAVCGKPGAPPAAALLSSAFRRKAPAFMSVVSGAPSPRRGREKRSSNRENGR
jgi:hypothetical protein